MGVCRLHLEWAWPLAALVGWEAAAALLGGLHEEAALAAALIASFGASNRYTLPFVLTAAGGPLHPAVLGVAYGLLGLMLHSTHMQGEALPSQRSLLLPHIGFRPPGRALPQ
jgi:hypothetical protein